MLLIFIFFKLTLAVVSFVLSGRYDLKLPEFVVEQLELDKILKPILDALEPIMHARPKLRTHNVVFVPVGSQPQQWHVDDKVSVVRFF